MGSRPLRFPLAILFAWGLASSARGAWVESGNGASPAPTPWTTPTIIRATPWPTPWPTPPAYPGSGAVVRRFLQSASLGQPYGWGGLTIYPVLSSLSGAAVESLDQALSRGTLRVYENGGGVVASVLVENVGSEPVFLMGGEIVLGGKQDRVIREDMVIGAGSGAVSVPVYCVEEGRWTDARAGFSAAPYAVADGELRAKAAAGASQGEIWSDVSRKAPASSTHAYREFAGSPEERRRLDEYVSRCPWPSHWWRARAVGAIFVADGGRVLGADLFGDPSLMNAEWPKLIRSYAAQVVGGWYQGAWNGEAASLLAQLAGSWPAPSGWAGLAERHTLSLSGYTGWSVSLPAGVVHVAALPGSPVLREPPPPPPPPFPPREPLYPLPSQ